MSCKVCRPKVTDYFLHIAQRNETKEVLSYYYDTWLEYKAGRQNGEVKKRIKTSKIAINSVKSTTILALMVIFKNRYHWMHHVMT